MELDREARAFGGLEFGLGASDLQSDEYGDEQDEGDAEQGECVFDRPPGRMG